MSNSTYFPKFFYIYQEHHQKLLSIHSSLLDHCTVCLVYSSAFLYQFSCFFLDRINVQLYLSWRLLCISKTVKHMRGIWTFYIWKLLKNNVTCDDFIPSHDFSKICISMAPNQLSTISLHLSIQLPIYIFLRNIKLNKSKSQFYRWIFTSVTFCFQNIKPMVMW